ncbi:MAG: hypothetical protein WGN25_00710 [Candidatus Electrothrix sp. GW3-4]|uniref:hypothetical protein n=1 Tax=Candidatus Electrothrix sp. GW3-4 TaxID=3126740 RepID=UPI0030D0D88C
MDQTVERASHHYKTQRTYRSLEEVVTQLHKGMDRAVVEKLLGKADYSPIAGQEYYSSERRERVLHGKKEMQVPVGLIIDYRDEQGRVTKRLQMFQLGRIGE